MAWTRFRRLRSKPAMKPDRRRHGATHGTQLYLTVLDSTLVCSTRLSEEPFAPKTRQNPCLKLTITVRPVPSVVTRGKRPLFFALRMHVWNICGCVRIYMQSNSLKWKLLKSRKLPLLVSWAGKEHSESGRLRGRFGGQNTRDTTTTQCTFWLKTSAVNAKTPNWNVCIRVCVSSYMR